MWKKRKLWCLLESPRSAFSISIQSSTTVTIVWCWSLIPPSCSEFGCSQFHPLPHVPPIQSHPRHPRVSRHGWVHNSVNFDLINTSYLHLYYSVPDVMNDCVCSCGHWYALSLFTCTDGDGHIEVVLFGCYDNDCTRTAVHVLLLEKVCIVWNGHTVGSLCVLGVD